MKCLNAQVAYDTQRGFLTSHDIKILTAARRFTNTILPKLLFIQPHNQPRILTPMFRDSEAVGKTTST